MSAFRCACLMGFLTAVAAFGKPLGAQEETFTWGGRMTSNQTLEVRGIVGSITATLGAGDRAEVIARKRGDHEDFREVAVEMARDGNLIVICAVYGSWNHGEDRCHPDHRGRDDDDEGHRNVNLDVEVDYEVRLPAGVKLEGMLVSGEIEAEGLRSDVSVHTVEGRISVVTTGRAWANSVSGDMEIEMGDLRGGELEFHTVSGDITLWVPPDFSAHVDFSSLSGNFDTDLQMELRGKRTRRFIGSRVEGRFGTGGPEITLSTVSGDVEIRRALQ